MIKHHHKSLIIYCYIYHWLYDWCLDLFGVVMRITLNCQDTWPEAWYKRNPTIHGTTSRSKRGGLLWFPLSGNPWKTPPKKVEDGPSCYNHDIPHFVVGISNCNVWLPKDIIREYFFYSIWYLWVLIKDP